MGTCISKAARAEADRRRLTEQPLKIPFLAAVVLHLNTLKSEFTTEILKNVGEKLQRAINDGAWREVKLLLRFFACLQGMFEGDGVFPILDELFSRAADLQMNSSEDAIGLELVKIILLTIPYAMTSTASGFEARADKLLDQTDVIASQPHPLENLVDPFPPMEAGGATSSESALSILQKHMQEEAKNGWELSCLPRPWKLPASGDEEDLLSSAHKQSFPDITIPAEVHVGPRSLFPEVYFSVYTEQEVDTVPPVSDTSSLLIRDALNDTINNLNFNRHAAARFLIDADCYFSPTTFVKRGTQFDKIKDVSGDRVMFKPEDVVVDACFANLFTLPAPEHRLVYYHSVLTEACKLAPAAVAPSLGRAIRFLYRHVERMDAELAQRFLDWFAHHLSNFGFTWKWAEWVDDIELPNVHPRKAFILDALDKEIRLSFAQRIRGTLPEEYKSLISAAQEKDLPDFKYLDDKVPFHTQAKELAQLVRKKAVNDDDFTTLIDSIEQEAAAQGGLDAKLVAIDAFVTALAWVGSKSISHMSACIERSSERLKAMAETSEGKKQIVSSVMAYWADQPGTGVKVVGRLYVYQVVTPESVVEWVLGERVERGVVLARCWCWELVSDAADLVVGRVRNVVNALRTWGVSEEKKVELTGLLERDLSRMKGLFALVEEYVGVVASGQQDEMLESSDELRREEEGLLKAIGGKWVRAWRRKGAVEESWVREELARPIVEPEVVVVEDKEVKMEDVKTNGDADEQGREKRVKTEREQEEEREMERIE